LYNIDNARTSSMKRPSVYLPTIDIPAEQSEFNPTSQIAETKEVCDLIGLCVEQTPT
jgi:hypothetical protein